MSSVKGYSTTEGIIRQTLDLPITMKYNMDLGISAEEIARLLSGESIEFIFQNDDNLPNINVQLKEVDADATLDETMGLSIAND